ncbi:hypothetical protein [Paraclostridium bifermentans]|nr:hypothetical protein [Paraclostridium bifermentans]
MNKNIKKQESIEKKMMDEIKENIGDDEFLNLEHNIKSDDFLQYIIDNLK